MSDYYVRAISKDAQVRVFACTSKDLVETARIAHNTSPVVTAALGRLLSAAVMMGEMLKGEKDLLTLQIQSDGPIGGITVTADSKGNVKGYAKEPQVMLPANKKGKLDVAGAIGTGFLNVIKDMGLKEPYVGNTPLVTSEIAEDLTYYFANSEQVPSSVGLGVLMNKNNTVRQAGGFIIQLMPLAEEEVIQVLEKNIGAITSVTDLLEDGKSPEDIVALLLDGLGSEILEREEIRFFCNCDKKRVKRALISIGNEEMKEIIEDGKEVEVNCHFCNRNYVFSIDELKKMQQEASK